MNQANTTLLESEVRQWLRDRPGMAFCGRCVALLTRNSLPTRPAIAAAVLALSRRSSGFLPGRCRCGELGVRYYPPATRDASGRWVQPSAPSSTRLHAAGPEAPGPGAGRVRTG